jgi:hypothetical protein
MAIGQEIATAFVRIRPNTTGFQGETESGVMRSVKNIAKIAGVAFGAEMAVNWAKTLVEDAGSVQKSMEVVNAEFGKSASIIHEFADNAGISMGITSHLTEATAARFGILFHNLGVGQDAAAKMTKGMLDLAGSIAEMRGIDPSTVLQNLPLALGGNIRVLRQLGFAFSTSQVNAAAYKLGLVGLGQTAVGAAKAEAIYALVTGNLSGIHRQAAAHANDFANVQRRLSAEWDHAKEQLGMQLLPIFTRYMRELSNWLDRMTKSGKLQKDFNEIVKTTASVVRQVAHAISTGWKIFQTAAGWVGGTRHAVVLLLELFAVNKLRTMGAAIVTNLVTKGLDQVKTAAKATGDTVEVQTTRMKAAFIGLGVTIRDAIIKTGYGAVMIATVIVTDWVINHWAYVSAYLKEVWKNIGTVLSGYLQEFKGEFEVFAGTVSTVLVGGLLSPVLAFANAAKLAFGWLPGIGGHLKHAVDALNHFTASITTGVVQQGLKDIQEGGQKVVDAYYAAAAVALAKTSTDPGFKKATAALGKATADAVGAGAAAAVTDIPKKVIKSALDAVARAIAAAHRAIVASVIAAQNNLESLARKLDATVNKIMDKFGSLGSGMAGSPSAKAFQKLAQLMASGAPEFKVAEASKALQTQIAFTQPGQKSALDVQKERVKAQFDQLVRLFDTRRINEAAFDRRLTALLRANHVTLANARKIYGKAFADDLAANIKAVKEQAHLIAETPAKYRKEANKATGDTGLYRLINPLQTIRRENEKIAATAKAQRERIAKAAEKTHAAVTKTNQILAGTPLGKVPDTASKSSKHRSAAKGGVRP